MSYEEIVETVRELLSNENIVTKNLTLVYTLPEKLHRQMNEDLFFRTNPTGNKPEPTDEFEMVIGGILIKFVKLIPVPNEELV
jgi:hypothetical protein